MLQNNLISYLWKQSIINFMKAKRSGKKSVWFDPVFVKFAIYLCSKVNTGTYNFMANVFNLPLQQTLSNYNTLDGQVKEGILYETLQHMENEIDQWIDEVEVLNDAYEVWLRAGLLKYDEMKVKEGMFQSAYNGACWFCRWGDQQ